MDKLKDNDCREGNMEECTQKIKRIKFSEWCKKWMENNRKSEMYGKYKDESEMIKDIINEIYRKMNIFLPDYRQLTDRYRSLTRNQEWLYNRKMRKQIEKDQEEWWKKIQDLCSKMEDNVQDDNIRNKYNDERWKFNKRYYKLGFYNWDMFYMISENEQALFEFLLSNIKKKNGYKAYKIEKELTEEQRSELCELFEAIYEEGKWFDDESKSELEYIESIIKTPSIYKINSLLEDIQLELDTLMKWNFWDYDQNGVESEKSVERNKVIIRKIGNVYAEVKNQVEKMKIDKKAKIEEAITEEEIVEFRERIQHEEIDVEKYAEEFDINIHTEDFENGVVKEECIKKLLVEEKYLANEVLNMIDTGVTDIHKFL